MLNRSRTPGRRRHRADGERASPPGYIATDMLATIPDKVLERLRGQIPVGRLGQAGRDRAGGRVPGGRRVLVHHRADLGGQRRPGYVIGNWS